MTVILKIYTTLPRCKFLFSGYLINDISFNSSIYFHVSKIFEVSNLSNKAEFVVLKILPS